MRRLAFLALALLGIPISTVSLAQTREWNSEFFACDHLHRFQGVADTFNFYLNTPGSQGLYLDTVYNDQRIPIVLKINNDYDVKVVMHRTRSKSPRMTWYHQGFPDTLRPGQYYLVRSLWEFSGLYPGKINSPYHIKFMAKDSVHHKKIMVWGVRAFTNQYRDSLKKTHEKRSSNARSYTIPSTAINASTAKDEKLSKRELLAYYRRQRPDLYGTPQDPSTDKNLRIVSYRFSKDSVVSRIVIRPFLKEKFDNDTFAYEVGIFRQDTLWNGTRKKAYRNFNPSNIFLVINGKESGFIYKGEPVNLMDSLGRQGKWISVHPETKNIGNIQYYTNNRIRSSTYYYPSGELYSDELYNCQSDQDTSRIEYYQSQKIKLIGLAGGISYHFRETEQQRFYQRSYPCSDAYFENYMHRLGIGNKSERGRLIEIEGEGGSYLYEEYEILDNDHSGPDYEGEVIEEYLNGQLVSRTYPKKCRVLIDQIEGQYATRDCQYIKESGAFVKEELYNGYIWIFDSAHQLTRKIRVINGDYQH